jgi:hypothetical protein
VSVDRLLEETGGAVSRSLSATTPLARGLDFASIITGATIRLLRSPGRDRRGFAVCGSQSLAGLTFASTLDERLNFDRLEAHEAPRRPNTNTAQFS